ncbi:MAG: efflux RND transporter periplasmic adaptor subunit [Cyclobacteriaceae bacterium]|nr:efflux RND transporter periplasmic adaptor subunit [Cyclobacteriaceae bacterium]
MISKRLFHRLWMPLMISVVLYSCSAGNSRDKYKNQLIEIPILELQPRSVDVAKNYICDIQAVQFVEVRAKVEGFVDKIFIDEGEYVKKGQNLFQLSAHEFNEMVNTANARLMQSHTEAKAAALEVERLQILVKKNIISTTELELAISKQTVAELAILETESMLKNARTGLSYTTIKAPFDGIIDRIPHKKGSLVSSGDLLTIITDVSEVFAYFRINEREYLQFMRNKIDNVSDTAQHTISLILADGSVYNHTGILETMEADFEKGTGSIAFRVRFPNPDQLLKHGATGKVQMYNPLDNIFLIPQKSTFEVQDFSYVYVLDKQNKVRIRSFKPLQRYGVFYITESFEPGDRIVYEGIQQVKDGMSIAPEAVMEDDAYDSVYFSL